MDDFPPPLTDADDPFADYEAYVPPLVVTLSPPRETSDAGDVPHVPDPADPLLVTLNESQREAVIHRKGALLIFAGAGSGKTRVLTHRIAYLTGRYGVYPRQILAVTFTNKAATEMKERLQTLLDIEAIKSMWVGTFHATCARILRERGKEIGLEREFTVYDDGDQITLMKECLSQLNLDDRQYAPRAVLSLISKAKEKLVAPDAFGQVFHGVFESVVAKLYKLYQKKLTQNRAVDFDDLIMLSVRLLEQREDVREYYQNKFRYVLVDEYQDINNAQYKLVSLLSGKWGNLCVVGDEDQCLPPGTPIITPTGDAPIESLQTGDAVLSTGGQTRLQIAPVAEHPVRQYRGDLCAIKAAGVSLRATPEHLVFARLDKTWVGSYICLCRNAGKYFVRRFDADGAALPFRKTDVVWILGMFTDKEQSAAFYESVLAQWKNAGETDPEAFLAEHGISAAFPQYRSLLRDASLVQVILFWADAGQQTPERCFVSCNIPAGQDVAEVETVLAPFLSRTYTAGLQHNGQAENFVVAREAAQTVRARFGHETFYSARIGNGTAQSLLPAAHVHAGMQVLAKTKNKLSAATVTSAAREPYDGAVHDLEIAGVHNYIAGGMLVHNSVYSWRGADVSIILRFDRDFKDAKVIKLEQNYRSTQTILDAAYNVVKNNRGRKDKKLWTENPSGDAIHLFEAMNEQEEAVFVADKVLAATQTKQREPVRLRHFIPHQRAVADAGRGAEQLPCAVQNHRRRSLLRTQGNQGLGLLPAPRAKPV